MYAEQLSQQDKMNMVMKGLSPINPEHIQAYFQNRGRVNTIMSEAIERVKYVVGDDAWGVKSLGAGHEKESDYNGIPNYNQIVGLPDNMQRRVARNPREQMLEEMDAYENKGSVLDSDRLLSLRNRIGGPQRQPQRRLTETAAAVGNEQQLYKKGYSLSIKYLNSFIKNLQKPSSINRTELYQSLKDVLLYENKLKSQQKLLNAFKKGCIKAETEMYTKLKG